MRIESGHKKWEAAFEHRPSWRTYGSGTAGLTVLVEPSGNLYFIAYEMTDDRRTIQREVYISLPKEATESLKEWFKTNAHP